MKTRHVARAVVYDGIGKNRVYLLIKAKKGGYWQNPQGGIDPKEAPIKTTLRETKEETGLDGKVLHGTGQTIEYNTERKGQPIHTVLTSYGVAVDSSKSIKLSPEDGHTDYRWVTYKDALKMLTKYPEQKNIFMQIAKNISSTEDCPNLRTRIHQLVF